MNLARPAAASPPRTILSRRTLLRGMAAWSLTWRSRTGGCADDAERLWFELAFPRSLREEPFTGRVYVFLAPGGVEPRTAGSWFDPLPVLAKEVRDLHPGSPVSLSPADPQTQFFPRDLPSRDLTGYRAQAVMRFNPWERTVGHGAGNAYGPAVDLPANGRPLLLAVDQLIPAVPLPQSAWSRPLIVRSERLSRFHGREVSVQGMVLLPASYFDQPRRRYPVIFTIPGFGGTLREGFRREPVRENNPQGVEFLRVTLDPSCPLGHHVFADSANNGPWGTALVEEFLPALEAEFRTVPEPHGRLLTGHSSGGWSSLWLQTTYPQVFGGVWSTAPDPVDFRDFQQINIYRPGENMFVDPRGHRRPLARAGGRVRLWYDDFCRREDVLGPGGQLHSFEAVFSPRGDDGRPRRLWDRETGRIDTTIAAAWTAYDIRLRLTDYWSEWGPHLAGKLHVLMGTEDTFYLEGSTRLLGAALRELGSDAVVELHEGKDHASLLTPELRTRIRQEMAEQFLRGRRRA
jgi:hypothetical protein